MRAPLLTCLLGLALAFAPTLRASGDMFRESGLQPGEPYRGRMLSVDELDVCLGIEAEIYALDSDIDQAELIQSLSDSRQRGLDMLISAERQMLDRSDEKAVADFNKKVDELGAEINEYNARVELNNGRINQRGALVDRFNADCSFGYYDADILAARSRRERRLAAKIEAEKSPSN